MKQSLFNLPKPYYDAIKIGSPIFPILFEFENGMRILLNNYFTELYGANWWEDSLKTRIPTIYDYVEDQKIKKEKMPMIGNSSELEIFPLHLVTLGHLEIIIDKYESECIPQLFPNIYFFKGNMEIIKRVRNMYSHMYPCITKDNIKDAKSIINIICKHINTKLSRYIQ